jgi:hypothetical protein
MLSNTDMNIMEMRNQAERSSCSLEPEVQFKERACHLSGRNLSHVDPQQMPFTRPPLYSRVQSIGIIHNYNCKVSFLII